MICSAQGQKEVTFPLGEWRDLTIPGALGRVSEGWRLNSEAKLALDYTLLWIHPNKA